MDAARDYEAKLVAGLDDPVPDVAATCAWVLGRRRAAGAVAPLCELIRRRVDLDDVRVAAIDALAEIGDVRAIPTLAEVLRDGHVTVRLAAVHALARVAPAASKGILREVAWVDPSRSVRAAARRALAADHDVERSDADRRAVGSPA